MTVSVFELFKIGIGPSSSHTVGPMQAAYAFISEAKDQNILARATRVVVDLYGSLALTGKGHGTDFAVILGLCGYRPDAVDPDEIPQYLAEIHREQALKLNQEKTVNFIEARDLLFHFKEALSYHPNGMRFTLYDDQVVVKSDIYYSVGGGFVVKEDQFKNKTRAGRDVLNTIPYPFRTGTELLAYCQKTGKTIADIVLENERTLLSDAAINEGILRLWQVMKNCIERGMRMEGILPGGLKVKRRAFRINEKLQEKEKMGVRRDEMQWLNVYALAVNEENAAGGRVVTAPTNGAAGIIPAVLNYYMEFYPDASEKDVITYFLTATAIGWLFKEGASISAAEMGCQGEVGVACSMAAGALCAVLGGTPEQIENAAEMGIEHHLGLTCDPIGGLVQIPCIERNTMGSVQAVNCAKLALAGDGEHIVSLDQAIKAMKETGDDMKVKYRETALGGLATSVGIPEC